MKKIIDNKSIISLTIIINAITINNNQSDYTRGVCITEYNKTKMAARLVALRADRSQSEVAEAIGVSLSALSQYEQGIRVPNDALKVRMADYFGVSIDSIFCTYHS